MIIIRLIGGLGNQMFQYAAAYVAAKNVGTELKVDNLYYNDHSKRVHRFTYRPYALSLFTISGTLATPREIGKFVLPRIFNKYIYHFLQLLYRPHKNVFSETDLPSYDALQTLPEDAYLYGFFQKYDYLKHNIDEIRREFTFRESLPESFTSIVNNIKATNDAICVSFRRGDYVGHPVLGIIDLPWYNRALEVFKEGGHLFVFSDDIKWCIDNFRPHNRFTVTFVDQKYTGPMGGYYMQLMMLCEHFVIPNSTYPYWAALLSKRSSNKIVVAPKVWYKGQDETIRNPILPDDWIAI